ncbi:MAG: hypothetical protein PVI09_03375 [Anaerolineae bacterium]|jgi:hypothetical protein
MIQAYRSIITKRVGEILIAGIRFRGEYDKVPRRLEQLHQQLQPHVTGSGMLLHYYFDESAGPGHDLEVCYPVSEPVATADISSHTLPAARVVATTYVGPIAPRSEAGSITDAWQAIFGHVGQQGIIVEAMPRREIYLKRPVQGGGSAQVKIEAQLPFAFFRLARLAGNLTRYAGDAVSAYVMQGSDEYANLSFFEKAAWFKAAMQRLEERVPDERTRHDILSGCADRFPPDRIQRLRARYQREGDIDALLAFMRADRTLGDLSWYEAPIREGNIIHVTKDPVLPERYSAAATKEERRAAYCHCGVLREALARGLTMPGTYCDCGAGWYRQLWEGILERPVRVDVLRSVVQGDDRCSFAIHLPS